MQYEQAGRIFLGLSARRAVSHSSAVMLADVAIAIQPQHPAAEI